MRLWLAVFVVITAVCIGDIYYRFPKDFEDSSDQESLSNHVTSVVAKTLKKEKGLLPCGSGGGGKPIRTMALCFDYRDTMDVEIGRELLVASVKTYLDAINANPKLRPHLKNYPFTAENIEIIIYWHLGEAGKAGTGRLTNVSAMRGVLKYQVYNAEGRLETVRKETYDEALALIKKRELAAGRAR
jgi:hypothetical protein